LGPGNNELNVNRSTPFAALIFAGLIQPINPMLFDGKMDVLRAALLLACSAPALPAAIVICGQSFLHYASRTIVERHLDLGIARVFILHDGFGIPIEYRLVFSRHPYCG